MLNQIKELADEAIALQNKDRMDAALREISAMCAAAATADTGTASATAPEVDPSADSAPASGKAKKGGAK